MKNSLSFVIGASGIAAAFLTVSAEAMPVYVSSTTYGGHTYDLWADNGISWESAQTFANSYGGYLAILTTAAEIQGVYAGLVDHGFFTSGGGGSQDAEAWLGARPADFTFSTTSASNWQWYSTVNTVSAEAWTADDVANFPVGLEPNGDSQGLAINRYGDFRYNDEGGHVGGFIVERVSVPDAGSTLMLLGMSVAGLGYLKRRLA